MASGSTSFLTQTSKYRDGILITCWYPDSHGYMSVEGSDDNDDDAYEDFFENECKGCEYYFDDYVEDDSSTCNRVRDNSGNRAISITYTSCCPCYHEGVRSVDFPCADGHDDPGENESSSAAEAEGWLPPMAYAMEVRADDGLAYKSYAWMQACDPDQQLVSNKLRTLNTFAPDHSICWGAGNSDPDTLVEVVDTYCDSPANADLLKPREYVVNRRHIRTSLPNSEIDGAIGPGFDAVLLVTLYQQRSAYLLLRGSGFTAASGLIAVGLKRHTLDQDGTSLEGFLTPADSNDRCWFLLPHPDRFTNSHLESQVLLLGQIPSPHTDACSSPAPSSSEPAALAAS
jgi:hypothetical protein